jgi:hypothetical protein
MRNDEIFIFIINSVGITVDFYQFLIHTRGIPKEAQSAKKMPIIKYTK